MPLTITPMEITSRESWLAARREDFTASDAGALFGVHKYRTLRQIAVEKAGAAKPERQSSVFRRGHILEPAIAAAMAYDHGLICESSKRYLRARDPANRHVRIGATKDYHLTVLAEDLERVLGERFPQSWRRYLGDMPMAMSVEMKSVDYGVFADEWGDGPPHYHLAQASTQAMVAGDDGALIVALVIGKSLDLHIYPVERIPAFEAAVVSRVAEFWSRLEDNEPQPVDARDPASSVWPVATPEVVAALDGVVVGDPELEAARSAARDEATALLASMEDRLDTWDGRLSAREISKALAKSAEALADATEEALRRSMGEAESGKLAGWRVSWKNTAKGTRQLLVRREKEKR